MNPVMYILLPSPEKLEMTTGKAAAQAAHAAVQAFQLSDASAINRWLLAGHYTKIVLMTDNLHNAYAYIRNRGFNCELILDEGRTEFEDDLTPTAIGVEILDKNSLHVRETFGAFKLYTEPRLPDSTKPQNGRRAFWRKVDKVKEMK